MASKPSASTNDFPANIGNPARRALAGAGYTCLTDLTTVRVADVQRLHGMGPKGIRLLREALVARAQAFADESG